MKDVDLFRMMDAGIARANRAAEKYAHESVEFTCCRLAEEVGELIAAATSTSHGRETDRAERMYDEALDVLAMLVRLFRQWPNGRTS